MDEVAVPGDIVDEDVNGLEDVHQYRYWYSREYFALIDRALDQDHSSNS